MRRKGFQHGGLDAGEGRAVGQHHRDVAVNVDRRARQLAELAGDARNCLQGSRELPGNICRAAGVGSLSHCRQLASEDGSAHAEIIQDAIALAGGFLS
jgi:hypothetical protein